MHEDQLNQKLNDNENKKTKKKTLKFSSLLGKWQKLWEQKKHKYRTNPVWKYYKLFNSYSLRKWYQQNPEAQGQCSLQANVGWDNHS